MGKFHFLIKNYQKHAKYLLIVDDLFIGVLIDDSRWLMMGNFS